MTEISERASPRQFKELPSSCSVLRRPSGAFAVVAIDQRQALKNLLSEASSRTVDDEDVTAFKLAVVKALSPHASAILLDHKFIWRQAHEEHAIASSCAKILAADRLIVDASGAVQEVAIDRGIVPEAARRQGAVALKLLLPYFPSRNPQAHIALAKEFVDQCHQVHLLSIIEPIVPMAQGQNNDDVAKHIIKAATLFGNLGADLCKLQIPYANTRDEARMRDACERLTEVVHSPWVTLSSGVDPDYFPTAVSVACESGASGFIAGRAVWAPAVKSRNPFASLMRDGVKRLNILIDVVDQAVSTHKNA